jgi:hypothetical protein
MKKQRTLKEQDLGTVFTDKSEEAEKLAKKGINVKLTKEQENTEVVVTEEFEELVLTNLKDVLRDLGEEISKSGISDSSGNTFKANIEFISGTTAEYKFKIEESELLLDDTVIADINIQPSGEIHILPDILKKGLLDYLQKSLDFQDPEETGEEDLATDSQGSVLEIGDRVKVKGVIFEIAFDNEKNSVYLESKSKKKVYGGTKNFNILLEYAEKLPMDQDDFDNSWLDDVIVKQGEDWEEKQAGKYSKIGDDEEAGITERLHGLLEIVVQMDNSRKATQIYKDGAYQSRYGINQTYADTFQASGESLERDVTGMEKLLDDFQRHGVGIRAESLTALYDMAENLNEEKEVAVGDRVRISKEYGGGKGKVVDKRGAFIVLDNGESYHETDVVSIRRDFNEDLHIGHQDDEPGMLLQTVFEIANYAADIHKMLKYYESLEQPVNFPNWWQSKVILSRDYISKAAHWLEYETRELNNTQDYLSERRKCKYNK